jgi:hypothetical protein
MTKFCDAIIYGCLCAMAAAAFQEHWGHLVGWMMVGFIAAMVKERLAQ